MTLLLTGGAGYIGSHMVHSLVDAGEQVVVLDNRAPSAAVARRLSLRNNLWVSNVKRSTANKQTSRLSSRGRLPSVHPGEILRDEFLIPMGISVYELANAIKAPRSRVNDIVLGRRTISTDTALRLGRYSPDGGMSFLGKLSLAE